MYEVYLVNEDYTVIHSSEPSEIKLTQMGLLLEPNAIPVFSFGILPENPAYPLMRLNKTIVRIIRMRDRKEIFEGVVNVYDGSIDTNNTTQLSYSADGIEGVLRDSNQPKFTFKGKYSELIKELLKHHNEQVEDWKQFELGVCEIDTYRVYTDSNTTVNQSLGAGDKATIKQTTKYIWNDSNTQLNIATSVLGVTHTVATVGTGSFAGKYRLRHPNSAWGISGWVQAEDIVETYTTQNNVVTTQSNDITKVTLKQSATTYYVDSYTNNGVPIASHVKQSNNLTINRKQHNNGRYALYNNNQPVAWIAENDLIMGGQIISSPSQSTPNFIEKTRTCDVEVDYGNTWDALIEYVINQVGGEIVRTKVEGVNVLNIVNRIGYDSDLPIQLEYNIQEIQEAVDASDIVTKVRAIGKPPQEEGDA